jgi:hypothetical protein
MSSAFALRATVDILRVVGTSLGLPSEARRRRAKDGGVDGTRTRGRQEKELFRAASNATVDEDPDTSRVRANLGKANDRVISYRHELLRLGLHPADQLLNARARGRTTMPTTLQVAMMS